MKTKKNRTNCCNCGSPLHWTKHKDTNEYATCEYCGTEYKRDNLGVMETNTIKVMIHGQLLKLFLSTVEVSSQDIDCTMFGDTFRKTCVIGKPRIRLELEGECCDEDID